MALFEVPSAPVAPAARGRRDTAAPQAMVWLNVGYEANGRFVSLPIGIPLDTMNPAPETGNNADWVNFRKAQNKLLKFLLDTAAGLQPGGDELIEGLQLQVRRVGAPMADEALGENLYEAAFPASKAGPVSTDVIPR